MTEREIEISFGTLFEVSGEEERIDVVINVGEDSWFYTGQIGKTKDGNKWFFMAGTAGKKNIKKIVGQMSIEEVIKAAEEGAIHTGVGELSKTMRDLLEQYSQSKPRLIK